MVHLMKSGDLRSQTETTPFMEKVPQLKLEIVDPSEEEHGPLSKRTKPSSSFNEWMAGNNGLPTPPPQPQYNPLDEPSPLGLRLRKSPSLLELIQMKLSQGNQATPDAAQSGKINSGLKKENKGTATMGTMDKLKASNFPASLLRIGCWEYKSRYEGDLVAKCYFAKHKLVWEVLEGGLKSKIEIQWSDIVALKAVYSDDGPDSLTVVLGRPPLFFKETNPQPRKHTLWQTAADFTDNQATINRQHFLQSPQGLLYKHFEKLIQCDMRLNFLSRQPEIVLESPYFEQRTSVFEGLEEPKGHYFDQAENSKGSTSTGFYDVGSPSFTQTSSLKSEQDCVTSFENLSRDATSPSSVVDMDTPAFEGNGNAEALDSKGPKNWDQIKVPGLHPSMSLSDLVNHIGNCITEQMSSANPPSVQEQSEYEDMLEDIAQYLLNDNHATAASDEESLMTRVNSLCCLLQKEDPARVQHLHVEEETCMEGPGGGRNAQVFKSPNSEVRYEYNVNFHEETPKDAPHEKQVPVPVPAMSRKDSFGDLLLHLPRIASLPKFLFNISEEHSDQHAR